TQRAIETGEVVYADGNEVPYRCSIHPHCKLDEVDTLDSADALQHTRAVQLCLLIAGVASFHVA
ncbi:hypothetical protein FK513_32570, partial [Klebsiella pneumoniae]|nr:hypothetical protein [Klebsiella pneumoniae]